MEQRQSPPRYTPNQNQTPYRQSTRVYQPYYYNPYLYPYWNPYRTWDNRTYIVTSDNSLTSPNPPLRVSVGVLSEVTTHQPTLSPYMTLGGESFVLLQYHFSLSTPYPYYPNIYTWEVESWGDESHGVQSNRNEFVIGVGKAMGRFSPFVGMGFGRVKEVDGYFDETYTLSTSGLYGINQRIERVKTIKIGTIYQWKSIESLGQISLGREFRIGLGIGIKL